VYTRAGHIVLRYTDGVRALDPATGAQLWRKQLLRAGGTGPWLCPATTPDSGIVVSNEWATRVMKLDASGAMLWELELPDRAVVRNAPAVIEPAGDVVIPTDHQLVVISPVGRINYVAQLASLK
jgi:outer membrane protein assembly factor BamB